MRKPPKLALAASLIALAAPLTIPAPAAAQFGSGVVVCANCASEVTAAMQQAQQVLQVAKMVENNLVQAQQYATQIQQYSNMLQNTKLLSGSEFGNLVQDIQRVRGVINQGKSLAYTASNLDDQFKSRFRGLANYRGQHLSPDDMAGRYQQWSDDTNDTALTALKALGAESDNLDDEADLMAKLQQRASTADGQMEAVQVGNELSVAAVGQMQKLRSLQMLQIQMMAKDLAARGDKEAAELAQRLDTYTVYDATYDGNRY